MGFCPVGFCPSGVLSQWDFVLHSHKVQGAKCAISKLMYDLSVCTEDNHSLKLVAYRLVHTDKPYINLHM